MSTFSSLGKTRGAATKMDVTRHVIREQENFIQRRANRLPDYATVEEDGTLSPLSDQAKKDFEWLDVLRDRLPKKEREKTNPLKASKRSV